MIARMKNKKRSAKWMALLFVVSVMLIGTACTMFDAELEQEAEEENEDLIVVGFSQIGSESVWRTANTNSIQNALSGENGFFLQLKNARQKQENQIKAIRSFISQRVDYIAFSPVTEDGWETVLLEAKEAGIPVILVDRSISKKQEDLYTTRVGTDSYWEGEQAGIWLENDLKKKKQEEDDINIVVIQGTIGSTAQLGRSRGFGTIAIKHPNWHILEQESGDFTTAKAKEVMQGFLRRYEDIDVLIAQNDDMAYGAIEAIREAGHYVGMGDDIRIIAFDGGKTALEKVQTGEIDVDIECNPEQGEMLAEVIHMLEQGMEVEKEYIVEDRVFTIDNVDEYLEGRKY